MRIGAALHRFDLNFDPRPIVVRRRRQHRAGSRWDAAAAASTAVVGIFDIVVLPLPFALVLFCGRSVFVRRPISMFFLFSFAVLVRVIVERSPGGVVPGSERYQRNRD